MESVKSRNNVVVSYLIAGGLIILVMIIFGILMLLSQGGVLDLQPAAFYQILTIHGTGMVGASAFAAAGIMAYFLSKYVDLSKNVLMTNLVFFLIGVVMVIIGVFSFEYASSWTFLYPLPQLSANAWGTIGALLYLFGMLILGVGFLLFYLDAGRAIIKNYGSLAKGLGWDVISGKKAEADAPSSTVVASTMVVIINVTALTVGAAVLIMNAINVINPAFTVDPLLAKNLTYAFGHIFANSIIYMGVIAVYEVLQQYTKRTWAVNKVFLIAWTMSTVFTLLIYTHHLLMDSVMPTWMLIMGQALSHANGLPVLVVTAYGALMIVYKSGIKWDVGSGLIFMSMFGWVAGVVPAIVDATIVVNQVMHNTKWVPGHFHMYMALGACAMIFGFMYYLAKQDSSIKTNAADKFAFVGYAVSIAALSGSFLVSGVLSTPRRWATHIPEWMGPALFGGVIGVLAFISVAIFVIHFIRFIRIRSKTVPGTYKKEQLA
ncbi:cbb3-type cytochrome c oxidase subunit I [Lentibacillus sp. CBA3610]|uniref:cbb3-type cytochrome c oxidase subunit I n=1 Tax=Lentibacillus sp. CBA3610 TaxID=2518176 RepID=UPI001595C022|nr:cbb3-type cytochrome c oxidase subunit I [Lentibacillus sp. CBA3610]QKY69925.1 cytochrome C oxidase subunit I [Lentibacillus sp. CBA3610]